MNRKNNGSLLTGYQESAQAPSGDAFAIDNMVAEVGAGKGLQLLERMFTTSKGPGHQRRHSNVTFSENADLIDLDKLLTGKLTTALGARRSKKDGASTQAA